MVSFYSLDIVSCTMVSLRPQTLDIEFSKCPHSPHPIIVCYSYCCYGCRRWILERSQLVQLYPLEIKARMQKYTRFHAQSFYDAMIFNMDSIGKYMLEITLHQQRIPQLLKQKKLMQTQEDHSNPIPALNVDSLKVDLVVKQNTCSEKDYSNSETASSKSVKECSLKSEIKDVHAIKYKM
ncbi:hypothetical protein Tco_1321451 [Tanacetum coccineum]